MSTPSSLVVKERDVLLALASHFLSNKSLSAPVLMSLAAALASELTTVVTFSVEDKKKLICEIIDSSLETTLKAKPLPAEEVTMLKYVIQNVIPHSVDLMYAATTGKLNLENVKATCWSCLPLGKDKKGRSPAWDMAESFVSAALAQAADAQAAGAQAADAQAAGAQAAAPVSVSVSVSAPAVDLSGSVAPSEVAVVAAVTAETVTAETVTAAVFEDLSGCLAPASAVDLSGSLFAGSAHIPEWSLPSNPVS
jgi:hypothetical protein